MYTNINIMIKKFLFLFATLFSGVVVAQQGTSSPYSFYGIGDVRFKGTIENRAMGSITAHGDSIHVNLQNPAYHSAIRLTTFAVGATYGTNQIESNTQSAKARTTALDYIAVVIPTKKVAFSLGLMPFSSVGYNVLNDLNSSIIRQYTGTGGINKVYFATSYRVTPNFSIGADVNYNFGNIETKSISAFPGVEFATREINTSNASGVNYNIGLRYQKMFKKKYLVYTSAVFSPEANLTFNNSRQLTLISWIIGGSESVIPGQTQDLQVADTKVKLPSKMDFGFGFGQTNKWTIGANILLQNASNFGNRNNDITNVRFENATRFSLGGYYIPNYKSFSSYFDRVVYRAGLRYENTGLILNEKSITDTAVTIGLGLPVRGTFSNVNFVFEYGSRGTQSNNLVRERYFNVGFSFSFNDQWFQRRKYD
jgi:hypothetical protein